MKKDTISLLEAYEKSLDKQAYKDEINDLKDANGHLNFRYGKWKPSYRYDFLIKRLRELMKLYNQDGQDIYEQFVSEINESNYPTEIKESLLSEIKNDLFSKSSENKKEIEINSEKEEIEKTLVSLELPSYLFANGLYDYENQKEIKEKLSSLPLDMQKKITKNYSNVLEFFENPSKELCLYALENTSIWVWGIPKNLLFNDLDIQLAIIKKFTGFPVKKLNLLPQAKIEYIKKHPEEIITNITKFNYNQEEKLTIYDLNKEELEIYKKSIEEYFVNKVKNDPTTIREIKNPSKVVKETALKAFEEQYTR